MSLVLTACPTPPDKPDAGPDAGGNIEPGPCTGGCGPLQVCDEASHQCVSGCTGGCDAGVCSKNAAGAFQCVPYVVSCNNVQCPGGSVTCIASNCSCTPLSRATADSCANEGLVCNQVYSNASKMGGTCEPPKTLQACKMMDCPSGACPACPASHKCVEVFTDLSPLCTRNCMTNAECDRGEFCSTDGCLASGLFRGQGCFQLDPPDGGNFPDGGPSQIFRVPAGNVCLQLTDMGARSETIPTGNCTYQTFRFSDFEYFATTCRPPGTAALAAACKQDYSVGTQATQCSTNLECMRHRGADGLCLTMCNAVGPRFGVQPQPACPANQACGNIYRLEDNNSVLGVCFNKCDVFGIAASQNCSDYGATKASCVPTDPQGKFLLSPDGTGICVPQKAMVANAGEKCSETDAFKGASCASGLICDISDPGQIEPICQQLCDVTCSGGDAGPPPQRCTTQPNAKCGAGKTCTRRFPSTTGATIGYCL